MSESNRNGFARTETESLSGTPLGDLVKDLLHVFNDRCRVRAPANESEVVGVAAGLDGGPLHEGEDVVEGQVP